MLVLSVGSALVLALVLDASWPSIAQQTEAIRRQVAAGAPFAACASLLVARFPRPAAVDGAAAAIGCALLVALASFSTSAAFTALGALLFALCGAVALRRRLSQPSARS